MALLSEAQLRAMLAGPGSKFSSKNARTQRLVLEALAILSALDVPVERMKGRRMERMALALLAVADVRSPGHWVEAKDRDQGYALKTRDIIIYVNKHFGEQISPGSYDDVRRQDLLLPVNAGVIVPSSPGAARNAPNRAYALSPDAAAVARQFGKDGWEALASAYVERTGSLARELSAERELLMMPVNLSSGGMLRLSPGEHNELQKAVIEEFLPRFGFDAEVLYLGDATNKSLYKDEARLNALKFFDLEHGELPDVVAYSKSKNWIFLIEAVHSFGPIDPIRRMKLVKLTQDCTAPIVFVTAFRDRATFRKFVVDLAWEQEVWIADDPDHMIHFNGDKFLGPHPPRAPLK